jgi:hypothetical protein
VHLQSAAECLSDESRAEQVKHTKKTELTSMRLDCSNSSNCALLLAAAAAAAVSAAVVAAAEVGAVAAAAADACCCGMRSVMTVPCGTLSLKLTLPPICSASVLQCASRLTAAVAVVVTAVHDRVRCVGTAADSTSYYQYLCTLQCMC